MKNRNGYKSFYLILVFSVFWMCVSLMPKNQQLTETEYTESRNLYSNADESLAYRQTKQTAVSEKKPYTIMVFMNGSDLESKYRAGTNDIKQMAASGYDDENVNLIIFTGGCEKWHLKAIPNGLNTVFEMREGGKLVKLKALGNESTGDPLVLAGFIDFCVTEFPAEKYGLILWNHGGGAVVGYGADERYENEPEHAVMKLTDIDDALTLGLNGETLEFLGFDTCLMSTLEMANIAAKSAKYLIASEEVEPEQGWDYNFLREIKADSAGYDIGKTVVDYYGRYYKKTGLDGGMFTTMSLTNLEKIEELTEAFENFAKAAEIGRASCRERV